MIIWTWHRIRKQGLLKISNGRPSGIYGPMINTLFFEQNINNIGIMTLYDTATGRKSQ